MPSYHSFLAFLLAGLASAFPQSSLISKRAFNGIATFNDYGSQPGTVCGPKSGISSTSYFLLFYSVINEPGSTFRRPRHFRRRRLLHLPQPCPWHLRIQNRAVAMCGANPRILLFRPCLFQIQLRHLLQSDQRRRHRWCAGARYGKLGDGTDNRCLSGDERFQLLQDGYSVKSEMW